MSNDGYIKVDKKRSWYKTAGVFRIRVEYNGLSYTHSWTLFVVPQYSPVLEQIARGSTKKLKDAKLEADRVLKNILHEATIAI